MLTLTDVSKSYNGKAMAVDHISLSIQSGQIVGFLGPNGAGKTTTLKMLTGILQPDSGHIEINGHDIVTDDLAAKREFSFVPDDPNTFLRLKGKEYLAFIADIYGVSIQERRERIERLAAEFSMDTALNDQLQSYSHGMRQKIILIGALLPNPPLWILDEPMTGLDPQSSFLLKKMMRAHADAGNIVLFSTHVLEVAEKVCDQVAIIDHGHILFYDRLEALKAEEQNRSLESIFLQLTGGESAENTLEEEAQAAEGR